MNEELYKKQLMDRFQLIRSGTDSVDFKSEALPDMALLDIVFDLLQGHKDFDASLFKDISLYHLTLYLRHTHAYYTNKIFFELEQTLHLLLPNITATDYSQALSLLMHYQEFKEELTEDMQEEEKTFIPYILWLCTEAKDTQPTYSYWLQKSKDVSLRSFLLEHHHDDKLYETFYRWVQKHHMAFSAYSLFRIFSNQMKKFSNDIYIHSLIEEHVVLPRAIEAEQELIKRLEQLALLN
jgi:regulator of cell morphogenesis and NO signaling